MSSSSFIIIITINTINSATTIIMVIIIIIAITITPTLLDELPPQLVRVRSGRGYRGGSTP